MHQRDDERRPEVPGQGSNKTTSRTLWSGEKNSESFTAFKMELQIWVGSLHQDIMKVMEVTEAKGNLMELDVQNAGMSPGTADHFKEMDKRLYHVLMTCTKREANNKVCKPERSGFKAWNQMVSHIRSKDRCGQVCEPQWTDIRKTQDAAECKKHHENAGTSGRVWNGIRQERG